MSIETMQRVVTKLNRCKRGTIKVYMNKSSIRLHNIYYNKNFVVDTLNRDTYRALIAKARNPIVAWS